MTAALPVPTDAAPDSVFGPTPRRRFTGHRASSRYVAVRDGTQLAADIHLPANLGTQQLTTLLVTTPYFRALQYRSALGRRIFEKVGAGGDSRWWPQLAEYGYATVVVEQRGAGASYGQRAVTVDGQLDDMADVMDWIVEQPWCDGRIVAAGVSAVGITAQLAAATGHPALVAVIPMFSSFDIYTGTHPGGLGLTAAVGDVVGLMRSLDTNRVHQVAPNAVAKLVMRLFVRGLKPVDDDASGAQLRRAVEEHRSNTYLDTIIAAESRDGVPAEGGDGLEAQSPHTFADVIRKTQPRIAAYAGFWDMGSALEMIQLVHTVDPQRGRLVIGPWGHAGAFQAGPRLPATKRRSGFDFATDIARFLAGLDSDTASRVLYYTFGAERWTSAASWPPPAGNRSWFLGDDQALAGDAPHAEGSDTLEIDVTASSGPDSRWALTRHVFSGVRYPNGRGTGRGLSYTSPPLTEDVEVTGHPHLRVHLSTSRPDGALLAYLTEVGADDTVSYVTEGMLRLSRRAAGAAPYEPAPGRVARSFLSGDARPMTPDGIEEIVIDLLPVSYLFATGSRIRLELTGADAAHLVVPDPTRPGLLTAHHGGRRASALELPVVPPGRAAPTSGPPTP